MGSSCHMGERAALYEFDHVIIAHVCWNFYLLSQVTQHDRMHMKLLSPDSTCTHLCQAKPIKSPLGAETWNILDRLMSSSHMYKTGRALDGKAPFTRLSEAAHCERARRVSIG